MSNLENNVLNEEVKTNEQVFVGMSDLDRKKLKETIKALTEDDKSEVVKLLSSDKLWEELIRRNLAMNEKLDNICEIMGITMDNTNPISAKTWSEMKSKFDVIEDKYIKIRKGFKNEN